MNYASLATAIMAFIAALCWLRAGTVKVTPEEALRLEEKRAKKAGRKPSLGVVSLDDWDMSETFKAQSRWNSAGALAAAIAALIQAIASPLAVA